MTETMTPERLAEIREQVEAWEGHILGAWDRKFPMESGLDSAVLKVARLTKESLAENDRLRARVAELEGPAVEARAALAALCYDLEDPGSNAFGALYLISQATVGVEAPKDDAALALMRHAREVLHTAADLADPDEPEVSFFGPTFGPQVAAWLRMLADQPARPAAVAAAGNTDGTGA